ncbi:MAG: hypothetical protein ACP5VS_01900 [Desulfomonilaceae bacterium]
MVVVGAIISVGLVSVFAYHSILGYFFTGTDTITLIETSRIHSFRDIIKLFAEPLMTGSRFVDIARFFRPIASLSYALDYAVWHLNPFGFQLTNLLLNAVVGCLVVCSMYLLSDGDLLFAWLSGLIFVLHPILVDSVPATDRRHDIIAALFLLLSLILFLKSKLSKNTGKWLFCCSILSYLLALGGKEIAIILPLIIFGQIFIFSNSKSWFERFYSSGRESFPYFFVTAVYLVWRTLVLRGLGGYLRVTPLSWNDLCVYVINIADNYILDLLYPADPLGLFDTRIANWWPLIVLSCWCFYLIMFVYNSTVRTGSSYTQKSTKMIYFLGLFLLAPLFLFTLTLTFAHRSMYVAAIPFSALLAFPLSESIKNLRAIFPKNGMEFSLGAKNFSRLKFDGFVLALGASMCLLLLAYSPIIKPYDQWEASGRMGRLILTKLVSGTWHFKQGCRVNLYNLPDCIRSYEKKEPKAKDVTYLSDYSIKSWLNLCGFQRRVDVVIHSRSQPWDFSGDLNIAILELGKQNFRAIVRMKPLAKKTSSIW